MLVEFDIRARAAQFATGVPCRPCLILGAAGMGKSAVARSVAQTVAVSGGAVAWINASVIASENQLFADVSRQFEFGIRPLREWTEAASQVFDRVRAARHRSHVLAVDDFDDLAFKRDELLESLVGELGQTPNLWLIATAAPSSRARLLGDARPLGTELDTLTIRPISASDAVALVKLRAPGISDELASAIQREAGGHPAALVLLTRLVQLRGIRSRSGFRDVVRTASELAGAVYAEPWAQLGPQQRAILWQLSCQAGEEVALSDLASAAFLQPSHVSAQVGRLVDEGLVERGEARGRYVVARLLARWIQERAAASMGAIEELRASPATGHVRRQPNQPKRESPFRNTRRGKTT